VFLTACATVHSTVSVFHTLPEQTQRTTYAFLPSESQEGSLEYAAYSQKIAAYLEPYHYIEVGLYESPDLLLWFSYGIDDGTTVAGSTPIIGQTGGGTSRTTGTVKTSGSTGTYSSNTYSAPTYGVVGAIPTRSTSYQRTLSVDIINPSPDQSITYVYQASVRSSGSNDQVNSVIDEMLDSLFEEFPGESGETRKEERRYID
tara:strand:+ start:215 stop:820 length:606 start_codon:yes stop_codon:yes gene_type:complete